MKLNARFATSNTLRDRLNIKVQIHEKKCAKVSKISESITMRVCECACVANGQPAGQAGGR